MILTTENRKKMTTPGSRPRITYGRKPKQTDIGETALITVPKLDSPFVRDNNTLEFPWYQTLVNIANLQQPTGVVPGTYLGLTIDLHGRVTNANVSGIPISNPILTNPVLNNPTSNGGIFNGPTIVNASLTGSPTAPTQGVGSNSTAVATTSFVHSLISSQGFLTGITLSGDVSGSGTSSVGTVVLGLQGRPVSGAGPGVGQALVWNGGAWAPGSAVPEAPMDGEYYARRNGAWVAFNPPGTP